MSINANIGIMTVLNSDVLNTIGHVEHVSTIAYIISIANPCDCG